MPFSVIPPYLLERIAAAGRHFPAAAAGAAQTLGQEQLWRASRASWIVGAGPVSPQRVPSGPRRTISDAGGTERLPGTVRRREGAPPSTDAAVNEAYEGLGATYDLFARRYGRDGIDGHGMPMEATVHYGQRYENAFWNGERMVFGDGDGEIFNRFTLSLSVIGHELAHGVTQHTAKLRYQGQSGALNESVSDVFGALAEQHSRGQSAEHANWLIGSGLFTARVKGVAIRSMSAPGTAYDDPVLGKDPQPGHMRDYVRTSADNGGVHINSGIPNRAFYLAASMLGGNAWERAGQIWYDTLTNGTVSGTMDFAGFAAQTVRAAATRYGPAGPEVRAVRAGWDGAGVAPR